MEIDWSKATEKSKDLINKICNRALKERPDLEKISLMMDIAATHICGCQLDLEELLRADDFSFFHDIDGIVNCIDRDTGKLTEGFLPRYAVPESEKAEKK